jgi:uncharacterized protein (TIGR03437 family)
MRGIFAAGLALGFSLYAQQIRTVPVASGISAPTDIQHAGDGSGRLFLVQQDGLIRILRGGTVAADPFLDIRSKTRAQGERGLLGLAFPPGYAAKGRFYVNYTDLNGHTVIAQYRVSSNPDRADASSEIVLLRIEQPYSNHNGGQLRFGPDGYLYIGMGDGGSAGDPQNHAQNMRSLLGKMLRVDVETEPGRVLIPADNPFRGDAQARPEIWASGLRNPWRFSFDRATGDLWIADVGQNLLEEIDWQPASSRGGENYGWNWMEGSRCFRAGCDPAGLTLPVFEYGRSDGCSVTGGHVYRGRQSPGLRGLYIYGDYCSGRIWGLERTGNGWSNRLLLASGFAITTFGEDEAGEVYAANANNGSIHRIEGLLGLRLTAAGVVNPASFEPGLVAGSLATAFAAGLMDEEGVISPASAALPAELNGVSVTVGGIAAGIRAVANRRGQEQVNFLAPPEIAGRDSVEVVIRRGAVTSPPVSVAVKQSQPAIYTADGRQAILVRNENYSLVTPDSPLTPGEYVFLYASGLGSGSARVTLGGAPCEVQYAGPAPGFPGVQQVNFRVPPGAPSGMAELRLESGAASSPVVLAPVR